MIVFTDYDCSDCNLNYINHLILSIGEEDEDATIILALYDFKPKNDVAYFDDIKLMFDKDNTFVLSNFDLIKNTAIASGFPMGPFVVKVQNKKIRYIRKVSQPFV